MTKEQIEGKPYWKGNKMFYKFFDKKDPITQINRLNIKNKDEWNAIKTLVDKYFERGLEGKK